MFVYWPIHRAPHRDDKPARLFPARADFPAPPAAARRVPAHADFSCLASSALSSTRRLPLPSRRDAPPPRPTSQCPARRLTPRRRFRSLRLASAASHLSPTCLSNSFRSLPARVDCPTRPATFQPRPTSHLTSTPLAIPGCPGLPTFLPHSPLRSPFLADFPAPRMPPHSPPATQRETPPNDMPRHVLSVLTSPTTRNERPPS